MLDAFIYLESQFECETGMKAIHLASIGPGPEPASGDRDTVPEKATDYNKLFGIKSKVGAKQQERDNK
jgi:hypothetical protein